MNTRQLVDLLKEAVALEQAGGRWTQRHAAAVCGYSPSSIRNMDCPKRSEPGNGARGKPRVFYLPAEVRAWLEARNDKAKAA